MPASYSIDTSAWCHAATRAYPFKQFPSFWAELDKLAAEGRVVTSRAVVDELKKKNDEVYKWVKARPKMIVEIDEETQKLVKGSRVFGAFDPGPNDPELFGEVRHPQALPVDVVFEDVIQDRQRGKVSDGGGFLPQEPLADSRLQANRSSTHAGTSQGAEWTAAWLSSCRRLASRYGRHPATDRNVIVAFS